MGDAPEEFCRLCQKEKGTVSLESNPELIHLIINILHIKVNHDPHDFPRGACYSCTNIILNMSKFIDMVKKVNLNLNIFKRQSLLKSYHPISYTTKVEKHTLHTDENINKTNLVITAKIAESSILPNEVSCTIDSNTCSGEKLQNQDADLDIDKSITPNTKGRFNFETLNPIGNDHNFLHLEYYSYPLSGKHSSDTYVNRDNYLCKGQDERHYLCEICGKTFRTKNSLNCHEKIHLEKKMHQCFKCNLTFTLKGSLLTHIKRHHEGHKFYCSKCTKEFLSKDTLIRHEKTHTGIREFKCDLCSKAFYTIKELKKHQKYHQGMKLFKCEHCFKSFFERHHLLVHIRYHTGERPFLCTISGCGKSFFEKQKLKRHTQQCHMKQICS